MTSKKFVEWSRIPTVAVQTRHIEKCHLGWMGVRVVNLLNCQMWPMWQVEHPLIRHNILMQLYLTDAEVLLTSSTNMVHL